jgi:hypothetical protein
MQLHSWMDACVWGLVHLIASRSSSDVDDTLVCHQCAGLAVWLWFNLYVGGCLPLIVAWWVERHSKRAWWRRRHARQRQPPAIADDSSCNGGMVVGLKALLLAVVLWVTCDTLARYAVPRWLPDRHLHWLCPLQPARLLRPVST